jgi:hypothetical protein
MVLRSAFVVLGLLAWFAALGFGLYTTVRIRGPVVPPAGSNTSVVQDYESVNVAGAGAALGFSIGGGLCFLAASLSGPTGRRESGPG